MEEDSGDGSMYRKLYNKTFSTLTSNVKSPSSQKNKPFYDEIILDPSAAREHLSHKESQKPLKAIDEHKKHVILPQKMQHFPSEHSSHLPRSDYTYQEDYWEQEHLQKQLKKKQESPHHLSIPLRNLKMFPETKREQLSKENKIQESMRAYRNARKGLRGIMIGAVTGASETTVTYPMEYIKTQLQLDKVGTEKKYDGIFDCLKKTIKRYGLTGPYRGWCIFMYGAVPKAGVRFGSYEYLKSALVHNQEDLTHIHRVIAGMGCGVIEAIFADVPMDSIKVQFIHDRRRKVPRFKGFFHGVRTLIKEQGIGALYKGVTPMILKQGTNQCVRFYCIETLKMSYKKYYGAPWVPVHYVGIFGAISGCASVLLNTPFDVLITRMQSLDSHQYKNTLDCAKKLLDKEGPKAFYKGLMPRLIKVSAGMSITFMLYDSFMNVFDLFWPVTDQ